MTTATRRPAHHRTIAAAAVVSFLALLGACGVGGGSSDSSDGGGASAADVPAEVAASSGGDTADRDDSLGVQAEVASQVQAPAEETKLISNGTVQLRSDDVGETLFEVRKVVTTYAGEVESSTTDTDDEGDPVRAMLTVRVPTSDFDAAQEELERVATLISSSGDTRDVTTEVLDRDIRIDVQRRSIDRISLLLDSATSLKDIVSIESQLSQRQADLAVLESEKRYLDDQTAMATITVSVQRTKDKAPVAVDEEDESGFLAGLSAGWDGLSTFGTGLATVAGALLPWLVVLGVLAIPGVPAYRRARRRAVAQTG